MSPSLFDQLFQIADPIVCDYRTDLTTHDRRQLAHARSGDEFLWAPYGSGTHLVSLSVENTRIAASEALAAVNSVFAIGQWYHLRIGRAATGTVRPVTRSHAVELAAAADARCRRADDGLRAA